MNARSAGALGALLLIASARPVRAADCASANVDELIQQEESRLDAVKSCAQASPKTALAGGVDGACVGNWSSLNAGEAAAASCMNDQQLEKFSRFKYRHGLYCSELLEHIRDLKGPYNAQCQVDWSWLEPYEARQAQQERQRYEAKLATVPGVLEDERDRQSELADCSKHTKQMILEVGVPDGVCSRNWSYLSPAETKIASKMSDADLEQFGRLKAAYDESCKVLYAKLGEKANFPSMCGADWRWLDQARSARQAKKAGQNVGKALGETPF